MKYIVLDLEWNGAYSKKAHGYFNEIIDIGAVALDEQMTMCDTFHCVIKPSVSKKLSELVQNLTHITAEELEENGCDFYQAMKRLKLWAGDDAALLTWSNTDLLVLMENFRFFYGQPTVPFMQNYADIQPYCQQQMGADMSHQMGLSNACEQLGICTDGESLHRALDDSLLTARIFTSLYTAESFAPFLKKADKDFYGRLLYKPTVISDIDSPLIKRADLVFECPTCGRTLVRKGKWAFYHRRFSANLVCGACKTLYMAQVQCRRTYDGVDVRRKLKEKLPKSDENTEESSTPSDT